MHKLAAIILVVGFALSSVVFVLAPEDVEPSGTYVIATGNSKSYLNQLERIGGKSAVVAAEFSEWFDGLWHGRQLAGTLAVLTIGAALACMAAARLLPPDD